MYDRVVVSPGQSLSLGSPEGGTLLLGPPGYAPGAMPLSDLRNRVWHLAREDGPDTGFPIPTTGDFNVTVVTRDLNIALGQFISETGLAPDLSDRMDTLPVYAVLDQPVPPALASISRLEYNPAGGISYPLIGRSLADFDSVWTGLNPGVTGLPQYFRQPFAGYTRLQPCPGAGNAVGDTITWYYSSLGTVLVNVGDTPGVPPQFHMALVYRVLSDYWERKQDSGQSDRYMKKYEQMVKKATAYTYDANRATQHSIGSNEIGREVADGW